MRLSATSRLSIAASLLALAAGGSPALAFAHNQDPAAQEDENIVTDTVPESDADATLPPDEDAEIVVTGTRIRTPQYDFATPVVSIDSSAIQNAGTTNLTNFLTENPALIASNDATDASGTNAGIGGVGLNLLDLRGLGTQRTLVLIDGRRHVAAQPGSAAIDINTIPIDLIDRIDIVTGGSAIYGADAVTGVVNFITKRDFDGINMRAQAGISEQGDAANQFVSLVAGKNFAGGRGNVALALEYGHDDSFQRSQRDYLDPRRFRSFYDNLADDPDDPNVPDLILESDVRYFDSSTIGAIDTNLDFTPDYIGTGDPFDPGRYIGSIYQVGGSGTPVASYGGELLPKVDRYVANLLFNYDLTDRINLFVQGKYARVDSFSVDQPTFDFTLYVAPDNAFLPENVRDAILSDPNNQGFGALVSRDNFDIGRRGEKNRRETYRGVIGIEAEITDRIDFELAYVHGESKVRTRQTNTRLNDRFFAALDAVVDPDTGNIVCRSSLDPTALTDQPFNNFFSDPFFFGDQPLSFTPGAGSGCVPFNLFSEDQAPGAVDWLLTEAVDRSKIKQDVVSAIFTGNLGDIRLGAGPIGFALGAEYRKESSDSRPDPIGRTGLTFGNELFPVKGSYDVKEVFGEVRVPLLADRPFFHDLTLNGAVRLSDYSTIGTTTTFQVGGVWAPVRDVRFRGSYTQAVRAPNIGELFSPESQTFLFITDPCGPDQIENGSEFRAQNCLALLQGLGLSPEQIEDFDGETSASIPGLSRGNLDLQEETAKTLTAGVVLQPRFVPGLAFSIDYYDVRIEDAVSTPAPGTVAGLCVDQPTLDNVFCDAIDRNPGSNTAAPGVISGFRIQPQNVAEFRTTGIEFGANYRFTPSADIGRFNLRVTGNYLDRLEFTPIPGGNLVNSQNTVEAPEWQINSDITWDYQAFQLNYGFNYFSPTLRFSRQTLEAQPDIVEERYKKFDARFTHDIQASIKVSDQMSFYGGVNNLFNQKPDVGSLSYPVTPVGRFFYFGARTSLGSF